MTVRATVIRSGVGLAALVAAAFLSSERALADGVLAIGVTSPIVQGGVTYGYVRNFSPPASAQAAALDTCRRLANVPQAAENCRVVGLFTDQCFAIAFAPEAAVGLAWAIDADRQEAEREAMEDCARSAGDHRDRCRIVQSRCDGSTFAARCGGHNGASPDQRVASCTALIQSGDESASDLVGDYVNRGNAHADRHELDAAIADYSAVIDRVPTNAVAYYDRGDAFRMKRDYDKAIADYDRAIALNPKYEDAFVNRGAAYAGKGDLDRAISDYTVALYLDGADAAAYRNRGDAYVDQGETRLAMEDYDEAIRRAPGDESAYRSRGALHFYLGDFVAAADDLGRVAQSEPDDPYAMLWTYLAAARGDAERAERRLAQAATQARLGWPRPVLDLFLGGRTVAATLAAADDAPQRCEAEFYVGEWQLLRGDRTAAADALRAAVDACPKSFVESKGAQAELK
ncbi:MAG TPA: tetratricopeptide repeat protein, partial [Xanthobacteraceae bacterium]|nr:tetratricopeptide repeat protein [Xanthobacteraceae bacterium]